jgi:ubiquitin carboxyl-terminal hydrolase 8
MTSAKLEDSLALSPEPHRRAFDGRHKADIVVVYDSHSVAWPRKGPTPSPLLRLWNIIYEQEFSKKLERTPVLLTGGYDAWSKFIDGRRQTHMRAHQAAMRGSGNAPGLRNGNGAMPL